ncbi:MAG: hypothetical protein ABI395_11615 [Sphingobium sp.]
MTYRVVNGRGGKSGLRYEVLLSSLPEAFQKAFNDAQLPSVPAVPELMTSASDQGRKIEYRWRVLQEILETAPGTPERVYEKRRAAKKWKVAIRTIEKWIDRLERSGGDVNALAHQKPSDAGQKRVYVSRLFDRAYHAAGHPESYLPELGQLVDRIIVGFWQSPVQLAGYWRVGMEAETSLRRECEVRGLVLPQSAFHLWRHGEREGIGWR